MTAKMTRRGFLTTSMAGGVTALGAFARPAWSAPQGANDAVRVAVVGVTRAGATTTSAASRRSPACASSPSATSIEAILDERAGQLATENIQVAKYTDVRKLLESKDVDAISIATPNHWHSLMAVWACQAGKDVYVEKPVSHNVWEGRKIVEAAAKYGRIVQAGTQSRSDEALHEFERRICAAGRSGKILRARGFCYKRRESIGKVDGPAADPARASTTTCGAARRRSRPLRRKQLHYDWHWVWATGNGDIGNQGIHEMDMCRWMLGEETLPPRVFSIGGRFGYVDDGETPNTLIAVLDYPTAPLIFEVRGLPAKTGVELHGPLPRRAHRLRRSSARTATSPAARAGAGSTTTTASGSSSSAERGRRHAHGELHPGRPQPQGRRTSRRRSTAGTSRRRCATWRTSRTGWARRCPRPT